MLNLLAAYAIYLSHRPTTVDDCSHVAHTIVERAGPHACSGPAG